MGKVKVKTSMEQPEAKSLEQKSGRTTRTRGGRGGGQTRPVGESDESKAGSTKAASSSTGGTKKSGVPVIQENKSSQLIASVASQKLSPTKSLARTSGNEETKTKTPPKKSGGKVETTLGVKRPSPSVSSPVTSKKARAKAKTTTKAEAEATTSTKAKATTSTKTTQKATTSTKVKSKVTTKKTSKPRKKKSMRILVPNDYGPLYQFKIELMGSHPLIWRQIQVPADSTFYQLHLAIQRSMGWKESHSHMFEMHDDTEIGTPLPEMPSMSLLDEKKELIARRFDLTHEFNNRMIYVYDNGDDWKHLITLERTLDATPGELYPVCIAGKRACPPEDVGGVSGYKEFLKILKNPKHEEYEDKKAWADDYGWGGDPSYFNPAECEFYT